MESIDITWLLFVGLFISTIAAFIVSLCICGIVKFTDRLKIEIFMLFLIGAICILLYFILYIIQVIQLLKTI